jgi:hypothetical protein
VTVDRQWAVVRQCRGCHLDHERLADGPGCRRLRDDGRGCAMISNFFRAEDISEVPVDGAVLTASITPAPRARHIYGSIKLGNIWNGNNEYMEV